MRFGPVFDITASCIVAVSDKFDPVSGGVTMEIDRRTFLGSFVATLVFQRGWFDPGALPLCPPGFEWTRSPALEAFVPCPQGWHFQETEEPGSKMAYFTRENREATGAFKTGFAVNIIPQMEGSIVDWCRAIVTICQEQMPALHTLESETTDLYSYGIEKINVPKARRDYHQRIRVVGVANKRTNTLYLVQFESPADRWDTDWRIGEQIYNMFEINPVV